jgi:hypothetical protein
MDRTDLKALIDEWKRLCREQQECIEQIKARIEELKERKE